MMENKNAYLDTLLEAVKSFENRLLKAKNDDAVPFSFFRETYDVTEKISRTLHELEFLQLDEMKTQMTHLVSVVAQLQESQDTDKSNEKTYTEPQVSEKSEVLPFISEENNSVHPTGNVYAQGIELPEYKKPVCETVVASAAADFPETASLSNGAIPATSFVEDEKKTETSPLDLQQKLSLNDRFLFQRELFGNDRHTMNSLMLRLQAFGSYPEVENYLRGYTQWDFENETVKEFLGIIKKGFE